MSQGVLLFKDDTLNREFPSVDTLFDVTDQMRAKGELFYLYLKDSGSWYKQYSICDDIHVPSVYLTLKLMLGD